MSVLRIRPERVTDIDAIRALTQAAFAGMPFAAGDEHELVDALRAAGALTVSQVAERAGTVIGHIALSPARSGDPAQRWYGLGPVSVAPACQRAGIGSRLVRAGLAAIDALGATGCILTGNPAYYVRFGFAVCPAMAPPGEPAEYFMVKQLRPAATTGPVHFHPAFGGG